MHFRGYWLYNVSSWWLGTRSLHLSTSVLGSIHLLNATATKTSGWPSTYTGLNYHAPERLNCVPLKWTVM
jgi:hypothetical protein